MVALKSHFLYIIYSPSQKKRNRDLSICYHNYGNAGIALNKQNSVIPGLFFLIEVSYERAENNLSGNDFAFEIQIPSAK